MRKTMMILVALIALLSILPAAAQGTTPRFEEANCWFATSADNTVECGYLIVPEDRANPDSPEIKIAVATFKAENPTASDPLIYLEGGPGGEVLSLYPLVFDSIFGTFNEDRDVILLDQRGIGFSEPALDCPEFSEASSTILFEDPALDDMLTAYTESAKACAERLQGEGINLAAYNSASNAADINDLRIALGYEQINVLGVSYGSRLALTIMRDFPEALRSVVIGAIYPPQVDLFTDTIASTDRVLNELFDGCAADAACNAAYPDLKTVFYDLVEQWNANPVTIAVTNFETGETKDALIDGNELITGLFFALYSTDLLPTMPKMIYDARNGDYNTLATYFALYLATESRVSRGMYTSVQCNEEATFTPSGAFEAALAAYPQLADYYASTGDASSFCSIWPSGQAAAVENEPVTSDVPTLLLSGQFDPVTPPAWGRLAAETLSSSTFVELPNMGHDAALQECPASIAVSFLNDPAADPDTSCIAGLPAVDFEIAGEAVEPATVTLVPLTTEAYSTVIPEGWSELMTGVYARADGPTDQTALVVQSAPASGAIILQGIAAQAGLDAAPESSGTREANGLTWTLYSIELMGFPTQIALLEDNGSTYIVTLTTSAEDAEALIEAVFYPVLDSFTLAG
ncbi:MAG: alpha/beta fold hydrolase [Anaerolineae bacterium]|nr:alpha/beta fold hydrolase [Anaerolineae bacterium]